jgi:hypothetical protein
MRQYLPAALVYLDLGHALHAGPLKTQVKSAYTRK